jgi:hypothetical protein
LLIFSPDAYFAACCRRFSARWLIRFRFSIAEQRYAMNILSIPPPLIFAFIAAFRRLRRLMLNDVSLPFHHSEAVYFSSCAFIADVAPSHCC